MCGMRASIEGLYEAYCIRKGRRSHTSMIRAYQAPGPELFFVNLREGLFQTHANANEWTRSLHFMFRR
jgi:hypothetical protein